jgi:hypothetical protein
MQFCASIFSTLALTVLLAACGSSGQFIEQTLDPVTGVTVLRSTAPVILYSDNSAYAAHARDYVYLGPVEVNRMGAHSYYLWLGIWSTMRSEDRRSEQRDGFETVTLFVDGQPLLLELEGWTLDSIGVTEPVYVKPVASAADAYYRVTVDQIRLIADAQDIELRTGGRQAAHYHPWRSNDTGSAAMRTFVARTRP